MKLTTAVQEALLALLLYDEQQGSVATGLLEPKHFDPVYREIAERAFEFRERFHEAPGAHALDIFNDAKEKDTEREELYERLFTSVRVTAKSINSEYVLDRARHFVRYQSLKRALAGAIRDLSKDNEEGLLAAESRLAEALKPDIDTLRIGTKFIEDVPASLAFLNNPEECFPTGIPAFDEHELGPIRKRLHLFVGPAKKGKSWWLVNLATRAHQHAKRVLYVTLELDEPEVCQRLVQSFFSVAKRSTEVLQVRQFVETAERKDWGTEFDITKLKNIPHFNEPGAKATLTKKLKQHQGGERVIVREFPIGGMTSKMLEAYLDLLENRERFVPDLLIVDYADIMRHKPKVERWEGLIDTYQSLKRLGQERSFAVASASQTKSSAAKKKRVDTEDTAGAWDKIATADTVFTYGQTDEERQHGVARIFVAGARTAADRMEVLISQRYEIGQFVLSSIRLGSNYKVQGADDEDRPVERRRERA